MRGLSDVVRGDPVGVLDRPLGGGLQVVAVRLHRRERVLGERRGLVDRLQGVHVAEARPADQLELLQDLVVRLPLGAHDLVGLLHDDGDLVAIQAVLQARESSHEFAGGAVGLCGPPHCLVEPVAPAVHAPGLAGLGELPCDLVGVLDAGDRLRGAQYLRGLAHHDRGVQEQPGGRVDQAGLDVVDAGVLVEGLLALGGQGAEAPFPGPVPGHQVVQTRDQVGPLAADRGALVGVAAGLLVGALPGGADVERRGVVLDADDVGQTTLAQDVRGVDRLRERVVVDELERVADLFDRRAEDVRPVVVSAPGVVLVPEEQLSPPLGPRRDRLHGSLEGWFPAR